MALRALSSATISFGLVAIPVTLYSVYESGRQTRFNRAARRDGSRVRQQLFSPRASAPVPYEIVTGNGFANGQYVLFTREELEASESVPTHTINIVEFVKPGQVDHKFLDRVYFLGANKGGARAYKLLADALRKSEQAAIARFASRGREHLVMLRPEGHGLAMERLGYVDDFCSIVDVPIDDAAAKNEGQQLALKLFGQAEAGQFDAGLSKNEVLGQIIEMIDRRVEGKDTGAAPAAQAQTSIIDIMEALKASLAAGNNRRKPARRAAMKTAVEDRTGRTKGVS